MIKKISIALMICLYFLHPSIANTPLSETHFIIWNVGQGQWVTAVEFDRCLHFDFGGEYFQLKEIKTAFLKNCKNKRNELYLSHPDYDHYAFMSFIIKNSLYTCWAGASIPHLKRTDVTTINFCKRSLNKKLQPEIIYQNKLTKNKNESSNVYLYKGFLFPGDSTAKQEMIWLKQLNMKTIKYLNVGHHGSKTSSSLELLQHLPNLRFAFVQARKKKYGHPHKEVSDRFKQSEITLFRTEFWGHIVIKVR